MKIRNSMIRNIAAICMLMVLFITAGCTSGTVDEQNTGEVENGTADEQNTGEVENGTADEQNTGEVESGTADEQNTGDVEDETEEEWDTGTSESGTSYYGDYSIFISGPEPGSPSKDAIWDTNYVDEENKFEELWIQLYAMEGALEEKKQELEEQFQEVLEGKLWGNDVLYYITSVEYDIAAEETVMGDEVIAMMPLGDDSYLQINIMGQWEPLLDGESLLENTAFQESFTLEIGERQ